MRTFIIFASCLVMALALTDEQKENFKRHRAECLVEGKPLTSLVHKLRTLDFKSDNEPLKDFALCMMIKAGVMTKDGEFNKEVALAKVSDAANKAKFEKLIDECIANKGDTPQQTAWKYVKCYHEKDPNNSIIGDY